MLPRSRILYVVLIAAAALGFHSAFGAERHTPDSRIVAGPSLTIKQRLDYICQNVKLLRDKPTAKKLDQDSRDRLTAIDALACPPQP